MIFNRMKFAAVFICGLVSGSVNAELGSGSLFFLAIDPSRNGAQEAFILDLGVNFLNDDLNGFSSIPNASLVEWLGAQDTTPTGPITWGVFGAGDKGSVANLRIASTVSPAHGEPATLEQGNLEPAIDAGRDVGAALPMGAVSLSAVSGEPGFPQNFGNNWNNQTPFSAMGGVDEALPMYIFGITGNTPFTVPTAPEALDGFWQLDTDNGGVAFAPVPLPAAVWLFGGALAALFGARRRLV